MAEQPQRQASLNSPLLQEDQPEQEPDQNNQRVQPDNQRAGEQRQLIGGTGFSFDISDFFPTRTVKVDEMLERMNRRDSLAESVPKIVAWIILFYSVCNGACVPAWIMRIKATKYLRIAWRFFMQSLLMIPFAMYQRRTGSPQVKAKYKLQHIFKPSNFKRLYFASFAQSFWFTAILFSFQYTYISHSLVLGALSNFFLSATRLVHGHPVHFYERGGQAMVIFGVFMIMMDSVLLVPQEVPSAYYDVVNTRYLQREWWQRLFGDCVAFSTSYVSSVFATWNQDLKNYYPSFLSMSLWFMLNFFNMGLSSFFFTGADIVSVDNFWGFFGLFSSQHIASFMYMSIVLMMGMLIASLLIKQLFADIIPAIAGVFQSVLSVIFVWLASVQMLPGPVACLGFVFIMPGMLMIIVGTNQLKQQKARQQRQIEMELLIEKRVEQRCRQRQLSTIVEQSAE